MELPRAVHIPLPDDVADALYELSRRQYRHPRQQAAYLLVEGLRRAGVLEDGSDLATDRAAGAAA
jgi:hypothetical protein